MVCAFYLHNWTHLHHTFLVRCFEDSFVGFAVCVCMHQAISTEHKTKPGTVHQSNAAIRRQRWVLFPTPQPWTLILARNCSTEDLYVCGFVCKNFSAANQKGHSVDHIQDLFLSDEFVPSSARACIVFWYANSCVVHCFAGVFWSPMAACHRSCSRNQHPATPQAKQAVPFLECSKIIKARRPRPVHVLWWWHYTQLCAGTQHGSHATVLVMTATILTDTAAYLQQRTQLGLRSWKMWWGACGRDHRRPHRTMTTASLMYGALFYLGWGSSPFSTLIVGPHTLAWLNERTGTASLVPIHTTESL